MQLITIQEKSNASDCYSRNLIEIAMVPKANIYEPWWRF